MSDYRIDFQERVNTKDASDLSQMLGIIDNGDNLTVIVDNNCNDTEIILKILYENGFDCKTSNGVKNDLFIIATRMCKNHFEGIH